MSYYCYTCAMNTLLDTLFPETLTNYDIYIIGLLAVFFVYFSIKIRSLFKKTNTRNLLGRNKTIKKLKRLSWDDFERLCVELFEKQGWKAVGNSKKGADGGIDIRMKRRNTKAIVQCKRYTKTRVTVKVLREMYGLMYEHKADKAYIVTTSTFTRECYKYIDGKNIELINGIALVKMIERA